MEHQTQGMEKKILLVFICMTVWLSAGWAQQPKETAGDSTSVEGPALVPPAGAVSDSILVTIILKHQQDKNLPEIRRILESQGFWDVFPPQDARVVSWTIAMGLGHVVLLKIPAGAERRLNLSIENAAWGAFETEIYLTYDYRPLWDDYIQRREEARQDRN